MIIKMGTKKAYLPIVEEEFNDVYKQILSTDHTGAKELELTYKYEETAEKLSRLGYKVKTVNGLITIKWL